MGSSAGPDTPVVVGKFLGPYGIKGWVKLYSYTDPIENISNYKDLWLRAERGWQPLKLLEVKPHGKGLIARVDGCAERESVPSLTGRELAIAKADMPPLNPGDYYWADLEGLVVTTTTGVMLGKVAHLLETGANDVLVVRGDAQSLDQQERLIPYLWEQVVKQVDLAQGRMVIDWDPDF